jgi:hypothetical protein
MGLVDLVNGLSTLLVWLGMILVFGYWTLRALGWSHQQVMDQFNSFVLAAGPNPDARGMARPAPPAAAGPPEATRAVLEQTADTAPTEEEVRQQHGLSFVFSCLHMKAVVAAVTMDAYASVDQPPRKQRSVLHKVTDWQHDWSV